MQQREYFEMSGLRIMFEVDEKHVGSCLVSLEGRAKNLNFEVIQDTEWQKNRGSGRGPGKQNGGKGKLTPEFVAQIVGSYLTGMTKQEVGVAVKNAGYKVQGLNTIMLSMVKKKLLKKAGQLYSLFPEVSKTSKANQAAATKAAAQQRGS